MAASTSSDPSLLDDDWDTRSMRRIPSLVLPFALLGAAAGFFATLGLSIAVPDVRNTPPYVSGCVALVVGAMLGIVLRRWQKLHAPLVSRDIKFLAVVVLLALAGAMVGITVVGFVFYPGVWSHPIEAAIQGAFPAMLFLPSCLSILDAGRRAARARLGSLVASVDRRTIVVTVTSAIVFCALVHLPAVLLGLTSREIPREVQVCASVVVTVVCLGMLVSGRRQDLLARARLEALARDVDPLEQSEAVASQNVLDLGMGGDQWGRPSGIATYRTTERKEVLLCGSITAARAAMDDAIARRQRAIRFASFSALASVCVGVINAAAH